MRQVELTLIAAVATFVTDLMPCCRITFLRGAPGAGEEPRVLVPPVASSNSTTMPSSPSDKGGELLRVGISLLDLMALKIGR